MNDLQVHRRLSQYENVLEAAPQLKYALSQAYDEAGKRQDIELKNSYSGTLYLAVFVPALIGFVEWVLDKAVRAGKDRIYFLSRDGWQMYLTASRMAKSRGLPIECRYLNVSRYSMKLPGYHLDIDKSIDSICVGGIDVTAGRILKRAALTDEECAATMEETDNASQAEHILNYNEVISFREKLRRSGKIREYIYAHSTAAYDTAVGYLVQEGLCRDGKYYIVDSGWIGTLQCSIEKLVQSVNPDIEVEGCYFGMYEYPAEADRRKFNAYYFSPKSGLQRKCTFSNSLFETIVSSEEGMTMGYEKLDDKYIPIKKSAPNPNVGQMRNNIHILECALDNIHFDKCTKPLTDRRTVYRLFKLFMSDPTQLELIAYGNNYFSDNVLDDGYKSVAAELDAEQIRNQRFMSKLMIILGFRKKELHESAWLEGSAVRAYGDDIRKRKAELVHIRLYKRFIYLRKQMKV